MAESVADWMVLLEQAYPARDAQSWDNVGLQVGDPQWDVDRILVSLDVTSAVLDEAAEVAGTMVIAHHPLLFRPLERLTPTTASGRLALAAARRGIAVAAAHTNLDVADDGAGTSVPTADVLGLVDRRPLASSLTQAGKVKLVTFVPPEAVEQVIDALAAAGAGRIGDYERCSFRVHGTGTFTPVGAADPYSGQVGQANAVDELRVEIDVPRGSVAAVVAALGEAHPYEEVAYDLVPLLDGAALGFGRVGHLPAPRRLADLAELIRTGLPAPHLRYAGDPDREVRRVAVIGGAGDSLLDAARATGAEVVVTGDLRHHVTLDALELGLAVIDAGHHATEVAAMPAWRERLVAEAARRGLGATVLASRVPTVPWR